MRKPPLPPQAKPPQRKKQKWKKRQTLCAGLWKRCCQVFPKSRQNPPCRSSLQIAETQIGELNAQIETAKQNNRRKENLDKQIPKTEDALRAAQDTRNKADKQIGMLQTQQHALAARIAELRQVLTCKD